MCSPRKSDENFSILKFLWIKTNVAYTRLEVIAKQRSALQVEFITGVKLICYFVLCYCFLHWSHLPNMAVGDLAFYYTLYLCFICPMSHMPHQTSTLLRVCVHFVVVVVVVVLNIALTWLLVLITYINLEGGGIWILVLFTCTSRKTWKKHVFVCLFFCLFLFLFFCFCFF